MITIDRLKLRDCIVKATSVGVAKLKALKATDIKAKVQYLFDASSFDCNKAIIAELFAIFGNHDNYLQNLNLDSNSRVNFSYPIGTLMRIDKEYGVHGYKLNSSVVVVRHTSPDPKYADKVFMLGMDSKGNIGKGLYQYGIDMFDAYYPSLQDIDSFVDSVDPETTNPSILHLYRTLQGDFNE